MDLYVDDSRDEGETLKIPTQTYNGHFVGFAAPPGVPHPVTPQRIPTHSCTNEGTAPAHMPARPGPSRTPARTPTRTPARVAPQPCDRSDTETESDRDSEPDVAPLYLDTIDKAVEELRHWHTDMAERLSRTK